MQMSPEEFGAFLKEGSAKAGTDPLTFLNSMVVSDQMKKDRQQNERQEHEAIKVARVAAEPRLTELYHSNNLESGRFDSHELTVRVGLENTQGNRMWVSRKLLEYRKADEYRRQGAEECQATSH